MKTRYYVCGLGYDEHDHITDYEHDFGDFDTYEEAYELFVKLQCKDKETFFTKASHIYQLLLQIEECEETKDEINCIDVKNEWWIINPRFNENLDMRKIQLGICYVSLLVDILSALKNEDYKLLRDYGYEQEIKDGFVQMWIDDLLENFFKPLMKYDKDTEIILED